MKSKLNVVCFDKKWNVEHTKLFIGFCFDFKTISDKMYSIVGMTVFCITFLGLIIFPSNVMNGNNKGLNLILTALCVFIIWGMVKFGKSKKEMINWEEELNSF